MKLAGRELWPNEPPYIVAEISANHNGSLEKALDLIDLAKTCGADAVKFQAYTPDTMVARKEGHLIDGGPWDGRELWELYHQRQTPFEWFPRLFEQAKFRGLTAFASVFDPSAVDMLEKLDCPAYKIASYEITDLPLIRYATQTGKPIILSTGMASPKEVKEAVDATEHHCVVMHCVSGYPTPIEEANLWEIAETLYYPLIGLSDHSKGSLVAIAATALGVVMIEKHLCSSSLDWEAEFSAGPYTFQEMADGCRAIWKTMQFSEPASESPQLQLRRSLRSRTPIEVGESLNLTNMGSFRPAGGLPPSWVGRLIGKKLKRAIPAGSAITLDNIA